MTDAYGDQREQKQAIRNFEKCVKPGGLLLIDHRNYDNIMETGSTPSKCIYYNVSSWIEFKFNVLALNLINNESNIALKPTNNYRLTSFAEQAHDWYQNLGAVRIGKA